MTDSMYTLGLSRSWNTIEPAWSSFKGNDPDNVTAPLSFFAATHVPISDYFFIDGGSCTNFNKAQNIYFNIQKGTWASSSLKGEQLARRKQHTAISDNEGRVWLWGGVSDVSTYGGPPIYYNTWTVIDTNTWTISRPSVENNPPPRIDHTATIISNKYILITGGVMYSHDVANPADNLTLNPVSMSSLLLFDIQNNRWHNVTAGGNIPAPRRGHSAVLSLDGRKIIIFGGGATDGRSTQFNDVFILELSTMQWTAPAIEGIPPKPRKYHKSIMVGNYLLVMFGIGDGDTGFDDVNLLSTTTWTWVNQYTPNPAWLSGNDSNSLNSSNSGLDPFYDPNYGSSNDETTHKVDPDSRIKAGITAGAIGGGLFLIVSIVLLKKRKKRELMDKSSIGSSNDPGTMHQENNSTLSNHAHESHEFQKPDNRSSAGYAIQINEGELYKPDVS
ncbi:hypothetical protein G6F70_008447 [Rhizopus microsporus]|nr:hypothetical protein G6F71_008446 [Rhizopus microsporus]KAG1195165.1 hypothetical protein G6F70_008447 [Rhizopus microsporus]KAG1206998.1 hypothetical protein G6F69_008403 [Rhizopus microsporus]KAG1227600.1 hypothetical protein G6F67_008353 [Rhizopus microsporus]KAG1259473.1 hypothetical protein G6F68_008091 [Rhizopus microsporus]